jgi:hypothetical protein
MGAALLPKTLADSVDRDSAFLYLFLNLLGTQRNPHIFSDKQLRVEVKLPVHLLGRQGGADSRKDRWNRFGRSDRDRIAFRHEEDAGLPGSYIQE